MLPEDCEGAADYRGFVRANLEIDSELGGAPKVHPRLNSPPVLGMLEGSLGSRDEGARVTEPLQHPEACTDFQQVVRNDNTMRALRVTNTQGCNSCGVEGSASLIKHETQQMTITGPKYFVPDIVYAPSDVEPEEVLNIPEDSLPQQEPRGMDRSPPSQEHLDVDATCRAVSALKLASWNVAGINAKKVKTLISADVDADVIALQEYPKMDAGWHHLKGDRYHGLLFQNYYMYRAVGVLFDAKKFHLRGRKSSERGAWVKLQHVETSKMVWIGSVHLPNSEGYLINSCVSYLQMLQGLSLATSIHNSGGQLLELCVCLVWCRESGVISGNAWQSTGFNRHRRRRTRPLPRPSIQERGMLPTRRLMVGSPKGCNYRWKFVRAVGPRWARTMTESSSQGCWWGRGRRRPKPEQEARCGLPTPLPQSGM